MRGRSIQATSRRSRTESEVMRSTASTRSVRAVRASAAPPAPSASAPLLPALAASRTSASAWRAAPSRTTSASCRAAGRPSRRRPSGRSARASWSCWPADSSSVTTIEAPRLAVAATRATAAADRLAVPWERTRSASSWASSTTRTRCSGSTPVLPAAAMPSMAWLVTTTSASVAAARASSGKHSSRSGQVGPRHSALVTDTCAQARSETPGTRSSRSPVAVCAAHSRSRTTCSPVERRLASPTRPAAAASPAENRAPSSSG